jgi:zinc transport system ATP-binding protein
MPLALRLEGVSFGYAAGPDVLRDVDLAVGPGEFLAVAGPNGGGKTTLVRLLLGLERPRRGRVLVGDSNRLLQTEAHRLPRRERARIAYLAQRAQLGLEAPATVRETVAAGRAAVGPLVRRPTQQDRQLVEAAIERVGLAAHARTPLRRLSGGQQQRAFIAKALAARPELLVLDEPTTGVDADTQEALALLLAELHGELGVTIVYVSHEFGAVERLVERLVLVRGGIVFDGPPEQLARAWHDPSHVHARP